MKIRVVVDSACDVPADYVQQYNMVVVPAFVNYEGQSYADDGVMLNRQAYYERLPDLDPIPTTSAPPPLLSQELIQEAMVGYDHLILVSVAAKLSSIHNGFRAAAKTLPAGSYTLVDSESLSMGGGWQAIAAARAAESGSLDNVLAEVERVRTHQTVYAAVPSVLYLWRGGRVTWTQAAIGGLLRIRPIVEVGHGAVVSVARLRTHRAWLDRVEAFVRSHGPLSQLAFLHTNNETDVMELADRLADVLPDEVVTVMATPSIGTHTGPNGVGAALVRASN